MSQVQEMLNEFVEKVTAAAGTNLQSVVLYGSASQGDLQDKYSDLNLLCVLADASGATLTRLVPVVSWWTRKKGQRPPLFVTVEELRTSADVFAVEMLDMKARHRVLAGRDLLPEIEVHMNLHRVEVEHDLRTVNLKLRQHFLLTPNSERELRDVLAKSISSVLTLLRHALIVMGRLASAGSKRELVAQAGEVFHVDVAPFLAALDLREERRVEAGLPELYERYMRSLATVIQQIDEAVPKSTLQKVVPASQPSKSETER